MGSDYLAIDLHRSASPNVPKPEYSCNCVLNIRDSILVFDCFLFSSLKALGGQPASHRACSVARDSIPEKLKHVQSHV